MGMFDDFKKVEIQNYTETKYFEPNKYVVEIKECKQINRDENEIREGKTDLWVVDAEILAQKHENDNIIVGDICTQFMKPFAKFNSGKKEMKEFLIANFELSKEDIEDFDENPENWENLWSSCVDDNVLEGKRIRLDVTKSKSGNYTKHFWRGEITDRDLEDFDL